MKNNKKINSLRSKLDKLEEELIKNKSSKLHEYYYISLPIRSGFVLINGKNFNIWDFFNNDVDRFYKWLKTIDVEIDIKLLNSINNICIDIIRI